MEWLTVAVRLVNAIVWTVVLWRVFKVDRPVSRLTRRLISALILGGFWMLVIGGLTSVGLVPSELARTIYTAYTACAGVIGLALMIEGEA